MGAYLTIDALIGLRLPSPLRLAAWFPPGATNLVVRWAAPSSRTSFSFSAIIRVSGSPLGPISCCYHLNLDSPDLGTTPAVTIAQTPGLNNDLFSSGMPDFEIPGPL